MQYLHNSVIGKLYITAKEGVLTGIYHSKQNAPLIKSPNLVIQKACKQLDEYFEGKRKKFDLKLKFEGTNFQKIVWMELAKIPYAKTISYSELAHKIKNPKAVRAVGSANGKNPFSIIIPCHRVIAKDGSLGGYAGGLKKKTALLKIEGIAL